MEKKKRGGKKKVQKGEREVAKLYTFSQFSEMSGEWRELSCFVAIDETAAFSQGSMRDAYNMDVWLPDAKDPLPFVVKKARIGQDRLSYQVDVVMQAHCKWWAKQFNNRNPPKKIKFLDAYVLVLPNRPGRPVYGAEPYIEGNYQKHSNNFGYVNLDDERNTPHAFSHFTYEMSRRRLMIVDLQGVKDLYTDPQIHSANGLGWGAGNKGPAGFMRFFQTHQCNSICAHLNLPPCDPKDTDRGTIVAQAAVEGNEWLWARFNDPEDTEWKFNAVNLSRLDTFGLEQVLRDHSNHLKKLSVLGCQLSDYEISGILAGLMDVTCTLEELDVSNNELGDQGAMTIAYYLKECGRKLRILGLRKNGITEKGVEALCDGVISYHNRLGGEGGLEELYLLDNKFSQTNVRDSIANVEDVTACCVLLS